MKALLFVFSRVVHREMRERSFRKAPKVKKDIKNPKKDFHIDADCPCAVVTMSSEHDQQDLKDKESVETMEISRYTWNQILQNMKEKSGIRDITFNTWLNPLRYYSVKDNTVIIMVPTGRTGVDYYSKKYLPALKASIKEITGIEYEVQFMPNIVLL